MGLNKGCSKRKDYYKNIHSGLKFAIVYHHDCLKLQGPTQFSLGPSLQTHPGCNEASYVKYLHNLKFLLSRAFRCWRLYTAVKGCYTALQAHSGGIFAGTGLETTV